MNAGAPPCPPLVARGITFRYPSGAPVLNGVDLSVERGQLTALIGRNGSGKTTLLRVAAGILQPQVGQVTLGGRPIQEQNRREVARQLAFVPQDIPCDFPFSVREVVLQGRHPYLGPLATARAEDLREAHGAMEAMEIASLAERSLLTLSAGQRQLVHVAAALAQSPSILLLDEPAAALDPGHARLLYHRLRAMAATGLAVVVVTHDLNHAAGFADQLVALSDGALLAAGSPAEVLVPEILQAIYGLELFVGQAPESGRPFVLLDP